MAVIDLWTRRDGTPSQRAGKGLRWRVVVPGHPSRAFARKGEAERWELRLWHEGPQRASSSVTVGELLDVWLAGKAGLSPKGRAACEDAAIRVRAEWGRTLASELDAHTIRAWVATITTRDGAVASSSTRAKALQCLRGALAVAVDRGQLAGNPADGVRPPVQRSREGRFLAPVEVEALIAAADERYRSMLWLMVTAGPRIGEVVALDVGDVDVARRRVRVRAGKGGKARDLPLSARVLAGLDVSRPRTAPLFLSPTGGRVNAHNWRARVLAPASAAAGLGEVRPHDLRHTAASLAIHAGASVLDVQRMLGHASATITLRVYGHLMDGHLDDVAARMDALLSTEPSKDAPRNA